VAYIDHEVAYHTAVLDAVDKTLIPGAKNEELKALLVKVRPASPSIPSRIMPICSSHSAVLHLRRRQTLRRLPGAAAVRRDPSLQDGSSRSGTDRASTRRPPDSAPLRYDAARKGSA